MQECQPPSENATQHPYGLQVSLSYKGKAMLAKWVPKIEEEAVTAPEKKKQLRQVLGGGRPGRGLGVNLSKREKQWPGLQEGMFVIVTNKYNDVAPGIKKKSVLKMGDSEGFLCTPRTSCRGCGTRT